MQVYNNNTARAQGRNGFFFGVRYIFVDAMKTCSSKYSTEVAWTIFTLIVTLRRLECGLKFYDFLIDIEEEIEG